MLIGGKTVESLRGEIFIFPLNFNVPAMFKVQICFFYT